MYTVANTKEWDDNGCGQYLANDAGDTRTFFLFMPKTSYEASWSFVSSSKYLSFRATVENFNLKIHLFKVLSLKGFAR